MRLLVISLFGLLFTTGAIAQIRFNNQWSVMASGGIVNGKGYHLSVGTEKILNSPLHSLNAEFIFQSKGFITDTYIPEEFNVHNYLLKLGYTYTLEQLVFEQLYIGFSAGFISGYEAIKEDFKTSALTEKDKFLLGGSISAKVEYSFIRKFSVFLEPQIMYVTSSFKKFTFAPQLGIKYYL